MELRFIISLVSTAVNIYIWLIVARAILSFIRPRTYHPVLRFIYEITEPYLALCRRFIPGQGMSVDFSPIVGIILLELVRVVLISLLQTLF